MDFDENLVIFNRRVLAQRFLNCLPWRSLRGSPKAMCFFKTFKKVTQKVVNENLTVQLNSTY